MIKTLAFIGLVACGITIVNVLLNGHSFLPDWLVSVVLASFYTMGLIDCIDALRKQ